MDLPCPHCAQRRDHVHDVRTLLRHGFYRRRSDGRTVARWRCRPCGRTFSRASHDPCFGQKKRHKNKAIADLLASCVSQRRTARLLRVSRQTVARKLEFLGRRAREQLYFDTAFRRVQELQFDDLETFEYTKCKPVSVIAAVEAGSRRILGFRVARMGVKGALIEKARRHYPRRRDDRRRARRDLFEELRSVVRPGARILSDSNPHYVADVKEFFPGATHATVLGRRGAITGAGELKKIGFDPLFSLNHTYAMMRANVSRLVRRTWCTTKRIERLDDHLALYAVYHNAHLAQRGSGRSKSNPELVSPEKEKGRSLRARPAFDRAFRHEPASRGLTF